jgi:hypothetical protein
MIKCSIWEFEWVQIFYNKYSGLKKVEIKNTITKNGKQKEWQEKGEWYDYQKWCFLILFWGLHAMERQYSIMGQACLHLNFGYVTYSLYCLG